MPTNKRKAPKRHLLDRRAHQIIEHSPGKSDDLLDTREVAAWLGVSYQWLEIGRSKDRDWGPPSIQIGPRAVRYRRGDVLEWLSERTRRHEKTNVA
jgi:predicted DNA-binding transcriptional regulator AlpA